MEKHDPSALVRLPLHQLDRRLASFDPTNVTRVLEDAIAECPRDDYRRLDALLRALSAACPATHAALLSSFRDRCAQAAAAGESPPPELLLLPPDHLLRIREASLDPEAFDRDHRDLAGAMLDALWASAEPLARGLQELVGRHVYVDPNRLVFELIQNADDAGATAFVIEFAPSEARVQNDGATLTGRDVLALLGLGLSNKRGDEGKIGRFGLGARSVHAITDVPEYASGPFAFKLEDFTVPVRAPVEAPPRGTSLRLPYRSGGPPASALFNEALLRIECFLLLTLRHVRSIEIRLCDADGKLVACKRLVRCPDDALGVACVEQHDDDDGIRRTRFQFEPLDGELGVVAFRWNEETGFLPAPRDAVVYSFMPTSIASGLSCDLHARLDLSASREVFATTTASYDALLSAVPEALVRLASRARVPRHRRSVISLLPHAERAGTSDADRPAPLEALRARVLVRLRDEPILATVDGRPARASELALVEHQRLFEFLRLHPALAAEVLEGRTLVARPVDRDESAVYDALGLAMLGADEIASRVSSVFADGGAVVADTRLGSVETVNELNRAFLGCDRWRGLGVDSKGAYSIAAAYDRAPSVTAEEAQLLVSRGMIERPPHPDLDPDLLPKARFVHRSADELLRGAVCALRASPDAGLAEFLWGWVPKVFFGLTTRPIELLGEVHVRTDRGALVPAHGLVRHSTTALRDLASALRERGCDVDWFEDPTVPESFRGLLASAIPEDPTSLVLRILQPTYDRTRRGSQAARRIATYVVENHADAPFLAAPPEMRDAGPVLAPDEDAATLAGLFPEVTWVRLSELIEGSDANVGLRAEWLTRRGLAAHPKVEALRARFNRVGPTLWSVEHADDLARILARWNDVGWPLLGAWLAALADLRWAFDAADEACCSADLAVLDEGVAAFLCACRGSVHPRLRGALRTLRRREARADDPPSLAQIVAAIEHTEGPIPAAIYTALDRLAEGADPSAEGWARLRRARVIDANGRRLRPAFVFSSELDPALSPAFTFWAGASRYPALTAALRIQAIPDAAAALDALRERASDDPTASCVRLEAAMTLQLLQLAIEGNSGAPAELATLRVLPARPVGASPDDSYVLVRADDPHAVLAGADDLVARFPADAQLRIVPCQIDGGPDARDALAAIGLEDAYDASEFAEVVTGVRSDASPSADLGTAIDGLYAVQPRLRAKTNSNRHAWRPEPSPPPGRVEVFATLRASRRLRRLPALIADIGALNAIVGADGTLCLSTAAALDWRAHATDIAQAIAPRVAFGTGAEQSLVLASLLQLGCRERMQAALTALGYPEVESVQAKPPPPASAPTVSLGSALLAGAADATAALFGAFVALPRAIADLVGRLRGRAPQPTQSSGAPEADAPLIARAGFVAMYLALVAGALWAVRKWLPAGTREASPRVLAMQAGVALWLAIGYLVTAGRAFLEFVREIEALADAQEPSAAASKSAKPAKALEVLRNAAAFALYALMFTYAGAAFVLLQRVSQSVTDWAAGSGALAQFADRLSVAVLVFPGLVAAAFGLSRVLARRTKLFRTPPRIASVTGVLVGWILALALARVIAIPSVALELPVAFRRDSAPTGGDLRTNASAERSAVQVARPPTLADRSTNSDADPCARCPQCVGAVR